jgi:hypothetical protein
LGFFLACARLTRVCYHWRHALEGRLRSGEFTDCSAYESHVAKYRSLMLALALILQVADAVDGTAGLLAADFDIVSAEPGTDVEIAVSSRRRRARRLRRPEGGQGHEHGSRDRLHHADTSTSRARRCGRSAVG